MSDFQGASRFHPFEYLQRYPQIGKLLEPEISDNNIEILDQRDRDLEDYLAGAIRPVKTFNLNGPLEAIDSDIYYVPYYPRSRLFAGGIKVYGSGTVTVELKRNGTVVSTINCTSTGLFVARHDIHWQYGDQMVANMASPGVGCEGCVVEVI